MPTRDQIAKQAAIGLRDFASRIDDHPALVGFDGFVDSIIHVVDQRTGPEDYTPIPTIADFAQRNAAAAGRSANYELVVTQRKLGGNGPIMAGALTAAGLPLTVVGALGTPDIDPVFEKLAQKATCHAIADPGLTDALEFADGKLMLGKYASLNRVTPDALRALGTPFTEAAHNARLLAMTNWTMLLGLGDIWQWFTDELLPQSPGPRKLVFVDLADPEKRSREDLAAAIDQLTKMQQHADVMLGLNLAETAQVARVLNIDPTETPETIIEDLAAAIRQAAALHAVVVHPRTGAAVAMQTDPGSVSTATFQGPFTPNPKLSTGAGDNFNAGFCLARLAELDPAESLAVATATSGYYVRNAASPSLAQLAEFCDNLPEPQS